MPVAQNQVRELLEILDEVLTERQVRKVLVRFKRTEAYRKNSSFRVTVDRALEQLGPLAPKSQ